MGENIWGRPKSPVNKREYGPGQHGQRRKNKLSDFGTQLRAKQKLKGYYGDLTEKQFRKIYTEAERVRGDTGEMLVGLLERRLDAVVYRAKFVPTIFAARQFVNHGHVTVNGQRVNIASYRVKEGDVVAVREKSRQLAVVIEALDLADKVDEDVIRQRVESLSSLADEMVSLRATARIGENVRVLIEDKELQEGRAAHQGPEVDGTTSFIDTNFEVGQYIDAVIIDSMGADLVARAL
jgi:small subunit ribosomal protein S4